MAVCWRRFSAVGLVAAHVIVGATIALVATQSIGPYWLYRIIAAHRLEVCMALLLSQAGLFGAWLGLSRSAFRRRLLATVLGLLYVATLVLALVPPPVPLVGRLLYAALALIPLLGVAMLMHFIRSRGVELALTDQQSTDRPGLQFSTRDLLILTSVIALLFAIKPDEVKPNLTNSLVLLVAVGLCAMCVFVGGVWAVLSVGSTALKIVAVLGLAALTGVLPAYYVGMGTGGLLGMTAVACVEAAIVVGSLLVIRTLGYRLVADQHIDSEASSPVIE